MITITNVFMIAFMLGLMFILGPTVAEWFFKFLTWFEPLSAFSTMFLMLEVIANIILAIRHKNGTVFIDNDYESAETQRKKNDQNKRWLRIAQITGIASIALIFLNGPVIKFYQSWRWFVVGNKDALAVVRYIGGILFTAGLFFFAGKIYQEKKNKESEEFKQPTPQSWEGYSTPPVQVIRRPDDAQIASWQQSAPVPAWQQPMQSQMPIVPMYQQPTPPVVPYEPRPMAQWQQENMWYSDEAPMVGYGSTQGSWEKGPIGRIPISEPQPLQSTSRYEKSNAYGRGKVIEFPGRKAMLDEKDLEIHLPRNAWRKLFGKRKLNFS